MPCECGHLMFDHPRTAYSTFCCTIRGCGCQDYAEALSDAETAEDIALLLDLRIDQP